MTGRKTQNNAGSWDAGSWEEELDIEVDFVEENDNAQSKVGLEP